MATYWGRYILKESDLFEPIRDYFIDGGHEVYAEVPCKGKRVDIVTKCNNIYSVVEMKTSINLTLIEQADFWRFKANYVYIAIPAKAASISLFVRNLLRERGIGILVVRGDGIRKAEHAKLFRKIGVDWEQKLLPEYKNNIAGSCKGNGYTSPYKLMIECVRRELKRHHDGLTIEQILDVVDTKYSNPKQGLYNALRRYESDWCCYTNIGINKVFKLKELD